MYELLKQKLTKDMSAEEKINRAREFLQILMLKILFDRGGFNNLAFVGGTALRILYGLRRYSEDLDFSLTKKEGYSFKALIDALLYELKNYGLEVEAAPKETNIVHKSMMKFPGLLAQMGLKQPKEQKLSIRLEIDTNPPKGWQNAVTPVTESFVFAVTHFDLSSMYATKLHACFFRKYIKGRDFYDLIWYLGKKTIPNFNLLNNAIKQTQKKDFNLSPDNIKAFMRGHLEKVDFAVARKDVERFLEDKNELKMLDKQIILQMMA